MREEQNLDGLSTEGGRGLAVCDGLLVVGGERVAVWRYASVSGMHVSHAHSYAESEHAHAAKTA